MTNVVDTASEGPGEFTITLIDESQPTVDGRVFEPGTVTWREPPLSLMYLTENVGVGEGHKGSKVGATITEIWRDGDKIKGRGAFGSDDDGQHFRRLVAEGLLTGVSADVGGTVLEAELAEDGRSQTRIMEGRIMGATVLPFPAFDDTRIAVVASAVPEHAPREWFGPTNFKEPTPLTITRDGQVFGHAALWGTCHIGKPDKCLTPPKSPSSYAYFRTGSVLTADGEVNVGPITLGTGHAGLTLGASQAAEHYDNTGTAIADVNVGEDAFGIWMAGAVRPGIPDDKLHALRASAISGDWRNIGGNLELVALLAVNVPGFPVPRTRATFAADQHQIALVAAGVATDPEELSMKTEASKASSGNVSHSGPTKHNDPTSTHNVSAELPTNAPDDDDTEPITEKVAASHRANVKEFTADEEGCVECGDETPAVEEEEELTAEEVAELTARLDRVEAAVIALTANKMAEFGATL